MRPLWKVTFTTFSIMGAAVLMSEYKPLVQIRIYRWRWCARLAAMTAQLPSMALFVTCADIEPYWPDSNVVPLRRIA